MTISVVVTGASGFIGHALVKKLGAAPHFDVIPVSRTCKDKSFFCVNSYYDAPVGDVLVHLAEDSSRPRVNQAGESYIEQAKNTMGALIGKGYSKIIYCSSAVVYGNAGHVPYTEASTVYPVDNYSRLKLDNESSVIDAGGIVVRLANVIGPGMAENNVLSDIIAQLHNDKPVSIRDGTPVCDFIWLDDVICALMKLIVSDGAGVFNIGTGVGISIIEMAELAVKAADKGSQSVASLAESSRASYGVIDIGKMSRLYGWSPKWTLDQSIQYMVSKL